MRVELEAGGHDDRADLLGDEAVLLVEADRAARARLGALAARRLLQAARLADEPRAARPVDHRQVRHRLRERHVDRRAAAEAGVELAGDLLVRAHLRARAAAVAQALVHRARLAADRHLEVADVALDRLHLAVGEQHDVRVLVHLHHARRQDALRAVERREGLRQLAHVAADRRLLLDQHHLHAAVGHVERRLDAGDAAADHQRAPLDRDADRVERLVDLHLLDRASARWRSPCRSPGSRSSWIHEQCSRMLAISQWNGLRPDAAVTRRNVFSCMCGEQAATTTPGQPLRRRSPARSGSARGPSTCTCSPRRARRRGGRGRASATRGAVDGAPDVLAAVTDEDADARHQRASRDAAAAAADVPDAGSEAVPCHEVALQAERVGREPERQADQLGDEDDRQRRRRRAASPPAGSRGSSGTSGRRRRSPARPRAARPRGWRGRGGSPSRCGRSRTTRRSTRPPCSSAPASPRTAVASASMLDGCSASSNPVTRGRAHEQAAVVAGHAEAGRAGA